MSLGGAQPCLLSSAAPRCAPPCPEAAERSLGIQRQVYPWPCHMFNPCHAHLYCCPAACRKDACQLCEQIVLWILPKLFAQNKSGAPALPILRQLPGLPSRLQQAAFGGAAKALVGLGDDATLKAALAMVSCSTLTRWQFAAGWSHQGPGNQGSLHLQLALSPHKCCRCCLAAWLPAGASTQR